MATSLEHFKGSPSGIPQSSGDLQAPRPRHLWPMIALIVATPLVACLFSFRLAESEWFRLYADPQWIRSSDRIYTARDIPCEVVVYGDSTAITGVDPRLIQQATGLKTCNIAQTKGVIVVLGTSGLDRFLQHNPRPRYLIMQFSGGDFYQSHSWLDTTSYMEGVVPLLRYYPRRAFLSTLIHHPEIFIGMMHYAYITGPLNWWINRTKYPNWNPNTPLVDVHFVRPEPAIQRCSEATDLDSIFHKPDNAFIDALRRRYSGAADHLLIDAAPISACDDRFDYLARTLLNVDNSLERFPVNLYNEGYTHYTKAGAERLSEEMAKQIESVQPMAMRKQLVAHATNVSGVR